MNNALEKLKEMSFGQMFLVGFMVAVGYYFILYDTGAVQVRKTQMSRKKTTDMSQELATTQKELARAKNFKETLRLKDEQFLTFTSYIPERLNTSDMMKSISEEAKAAGVNILSIREARGADSAKYEYTDPLGIEVTLDGGFPQHILFLSYLTRLDSILTVNEMSFKAKSNADTDPFNIRVEFKAVIVGYRYVGQEVAGTKK